MKDLESPEDFDELLSEAITEEVILTDLYPAGDERRAFVRAIAIADYEPWQVQAVRVNDEKRDHKGLKEELVIKALCRKDGRPAFDRGDPAHLKRVKALPVPVLDRLFDAAQRINQVDSKSLDDTGKN